MPKIKVAKFGVAESETKLRLLSLAVHFHCGSKNPNSTLCEARIPSQTTSAATPARAAQFFTQECNEVNTVKRVYVKTLCKLLM